MGVNTRYFPASDMNPTTLQSFLLSVNPNLVTSIDTNTNSLIVEISDNVTCRFRSYKTGNWNFDFYVTINGGTETFIGSQRTSMTLVAIITDTYFSMWATGGYDGDENYVVYETVDNRELVSYAHNARTNPYYRTMTDISDSSTYSHVVLLNYNAGVGYIDYINGDMVVSSNNRAFIDSNFLACSIMTAGTVITINGNNYYVVASNAIMPIN